MSSSRSVFGRLLPPHYLDPAHPSIPAVPLRGLQGHPRVHRRLHLPLDEEQGEQSAAQPGALPQADRRLGLKKTLDNFNMTKRPQSRLGCSSDTS